MDLRAGQNVAVSTGVVQVHLQQGAQPEVDLVALLLDARAQVRADADFVYYNAPHHPTGAAKVQGQVLTLDLRRLPADVERVMVAANSDRELDGLNVLVESDEAFSFAPLSLAGLPTAVLVEVYRRAGGWRIRAVGQGWAAGLAGLVREYGITVDEETDQPNTTSSPEPGLLAVESELQRLTARRDALARDVADLEQRVRAARQALVETDELRLLQQAGYYQFRHPLDDVLSSKKRLDDLRGQIKSAISKRTAVRGKSAGW